MLSKFQQKLVDTCKDAGYGWAEFAKSVEAQEWCSPKQESTLIGMCARISTANINKAQRRNNGHSHPGYDNISDNEAMRSGDYF